MSSMKIAAETTAAVPRMVRKDMWQWNSVVERAAVGEQLQLPRAMPRPRPATGTAKRFFFQVLAEAPAELTSKSTTSRIATAPHRGGTAGERHRVS